MNASLPPATGFLGDLEARAKAENPDLVRTPPSLREPSPRPSTPGPPTSIVLPVDNAAPVASTSTLDAPGAATTPSTTVAVKKKRPLPASPPPRKPKKPQPTIRLEIDLFSRLEGSKDEAYELNFEEEAVEAGLRVIQSESERDDSESDGSDDDSEEDVQPQNVISNTTATLLGAAPIARASKRKRKAVQDRDEGYDTSDSFVDDSELHTDMPKFYVRPKRDGFYVANGPLELFELTKTRKSTTTTTKSKVTNSTSEPPAKKAKKVPLTTTALPTANGSSSSQPVKHERAGSQSAPIAIDSESEVKKPMGGGAVTFSAASAKGTPVKKAVADDKPASIDNLAPELQTMAKELKAQVAVTSFEPKNKFPLSLKPKLQDFAFKAIEHRQYDDHFFKILPLIFPYNEFTMRKLTKREIFPKRMEDLREHQDRLIAQLAGAIPAQQPISETQHVKELETYETKIAKYKEAQNAMAVDTPVAGDGAAAAPTSKGRKPAEPVKKLVFSEEMNRMFYEILIIEDEMNNLTLEKMELDKSEADKPSALSARKALYQRLLGLFPSEWMSTNILSRRWSAVKLKYGGGGADEEE